METKPGVCGAKCRDGSACDAPPIVGSRRCHLHGGLSTGATSDAGRMRLSESMRRRWDRYLGRTKGDA